MERLTKVMHCDDGNKLYDYSNEVVREYKDFSSRLELMFEKLAEYEDAEEQGLLVRLPTEAYFIKDNIVCKGWVQELIYSSCRKLLLDIRYDDNSLDSYRGYVGNTVFLTKEEAEQKLKEMESD